MQENNDEMNTRKNTSIKELATALCKFQSSIGAIAKDASNPFFKSKYASLSAIIEDTRKPLGENGLSFAQFPTGEAGLTTILMHSSGEWMSSTFTIHPVDQKPQSLGSAIIYARRYALSAILGLQVDDDDGNEASKPKKQTWPAKRVVQDEYDQTPVADNVAVISTGDDTGEEPPKSSEPAPAKRPTVLQKKKLIMDLLSKQSKAVLVTKDDFEDACFVITGFDLKDENKLDEIIRKLNELQNGKLGKN